MLVHHLHHVHSSSISSFNRSITPAHSNAHSTHWLSLYTRFSPRRLSPAVRLAINYLCGGNKGGGELVVKDEEGGEDELVEEIEVEDEEGELVVEDEEDGE